MKLMKRIEVLRKVVSTLDDRQTYSVGSILHLALEQGCVAKRDLLRLRLSLSRLAQQYDFPVEGDALINLKNQAPVPSWLGHRWKQAVVGPTIGGTHG